VAVSVLAALSLPALSTRTETKQATPAPVRIVGAPGAKEGCAEQTWPYMDARCLTRDANNAAPLAGTAPPASASPTVPAPPAPQVVPLAPQAAMAELSASVRPQSLPSNPQPIARDPANKVAAMPADPRERVPESARLALPPPPGAEPRLPDEMPASTSQNTDAARLAAIAGTVAAGPAMTRSPAMQERTIRPRAERRRGAIRPGRSFGLFGFRSAR
jgi:hypothetical protein